MTWLSSPVTTMFIIGYFYVDIWVHPKARESLIFRIRFKKEVGCGVNLGRELYCACSHSAKTIGIVAVAATGNVFRLPTSLASLAKGHDATHNVTNLQLLSQGQTLFARPGSKTTHAMLFRKST